MGSSFWANGMDTGVSRSPPEGVIVGEEKEMRIGRGKLERDCGKLDVPNYRTWIKKKIS